jgi:hypothetical protein
MRTLLMALTTVGALAASSSLAQQQGADPEAHHPPATQAAPAPAPPGPNGMAGTMMMDQCKSMMSMQRESTTAGERAPAQPNRTMPARPGATPAQPGAALSPAQREAMRKQCAEMMQRAEAAPGGPASK